MGALVLSVSVGAADADPSKVDRKAVLHNLLASVYPNVTGSRELFAELDKNPALRAEVLELIAADADLKDRASEGLEFLQNYNKTLLAGLQPLTQAIILDPGEAALDSVQKFKASNIEIQETPLPEWKILQDSWKETVDRFSLDSSLTVSELARIRNTNPVLLRAFEFYQSTLRRREYFETPKLVDNPKIDLPRWRHYFTRQIQLAREHNIRRALEVSAGFSDKNINFKLNLVSEGFWEAMGEAFLRTYDIRLTAADLKTARIWIEDGPTEPLEKAEMVYIQTVRNTTARSLYNLVRGTFRAFLTINGKLNFFRSRVFKTADRPIKYSQFYNESPFVKSGARFKIALNPETLQPQTRERLKDFGYVINLDEDDMAKAMELMFTDAVLHFETADAAAKRFVSETGLRDMQMASVQKLIEDDRNELAKKFIAELSEANSAFDRYTSVSTYPTTLMDQARADSRVADGLKSDAVSGLRWWGHSIYPTYWAVRDAVARKNGRPEFTEVLAGSREPKRDIYPRPFSRMASHFRTGSRVKRALITAGILSLAYSAPLWAEPVRSTAVGALQAAGETIASLIPKFEGGSSASDNKTYTDDAPKKPGFSPYEKPKIHPQSALSNAKSTIYFKITEGPKGMPEGMSYFYSFADDFSNYLVKDGAGGVELKKHARYGWDAGYRVTDPFAEVDYFTDQFPSQRADYYIETQFFTHEYDLKQPISIPLANDHKVASVEYKTEWETKWDTKGPWKRFEIANVYYIDGYAFLDAFDYRSFGNLTLRIGYQMPSAPDQAPQIHKGLNAQALKQSTQQLGGAGFTAIQAEMGRRIVSGEQLTFRSLEAAISASSVYTYVNPRGKNFGDASSPYFDLTEFLKKGVYYTQCTGAFEMMRRFSESYLQLAGDPAVSVNPYIGFAVDSFDPTLITAGGGHITARFVQTADGQSATFDATPFQEGVPSKVNDPVKNPGKNQRTTSLQPADRWRREIWDSFLRETQEAINELKKFKAGIAPRTQQIAVLENQLKELRQAIKKAQPNGADFLQSPTVGLLDILPDLVAFHRHELSWDTTRDRMLRKLSPFIAPGSDTSTAKAILGDYYKQIQQYFAKLNDMNDHKPESVSHLHALLDLKFQQAVLHYTSAIYHTDWQPVLFRPSSANCQTLLMSSRIQESSRIWKPLFKKTNPILENTP